MEKPRNQQGGLRPVPVALTIIAIFIAALALVPPYYDSFLARNRDSPETPKPSFEVLEKRIIDLEIKVSGNTSSGANDASTKHVRSLKNNYDLDFSALSLPTDVSNTPSSINGLAVCNYGSSVKRIAFASLQKGRVKSKGWWLVDKRKCTLLTGDYSTKPTHYAFDNPPSVLITILRETDEDYREPTRGNVDFCVGFGELFNYDSFVDCEKLGGKDLSFTPFPFRSFSTSTILIGDYSSRQELSKFISNGSLPGVDLKK